MSRKLVSILLMLVLTLAVIAPVGAIAENSNILGDINGDSSINGKDVLTLRKNIVGLPVDVFVTENADVNEDGNINGKDVLLLRKILSDARIRHDAAGKENRKIAAALAKVLGETKQNAAQIFKKKGRHIFGRGVFFNKVVRFVFQPRKRTGKPVYRNGNLTEGDGRSLRQLVQSLPAGKGNPETHAGTVDRLSRIEIGRSADLFARESTVGGLFAKHDIGRTA